MPLRLEPVLAQTEHRVLDVLTFIVLGVLLSAGLYAAFRLGALPGQIARQRAHPQADAINVAGWLGVLTLGLLWPFALIWAFTRSRAAPDAEPEQSRELQSLSGRIRALEERGLQREKRSES
jgi:hypothetical protein